LIRYQAASKTKKYEPNEVAPVEPGTTSDDVQGEMEQEYKMGVGGT
jgi:hypothetical protein